MKSILHVVSERVSRLSILEALTAPSGGVGRRLGCSVPRKLRRRKMASVFSLVAVAASLIRMRTGPQAVLMTVLGSLAMGLASNSAKAGDCNCDSSPCIPCNGLEQTPDFRNLSSANKGIVTEDDLNGPWIGSVKRVAQAPVGGRGGRGARWVMGASPSPGRLRPCRGTGLLFS